MVLVCLPSDALFQYLPSYLGFSYLGRGVSLHGCSSKAQPLLLTLDEGYLLTATPPDLERGVAPFGPPAPAQQPLLGRCQGRSPHCLSPCQRLHPRSWEGAKSQEQTHSTRESKDVLLKVEVKNAGGKTIRNPLVTNIKVSRMKVNR